LGDFSMQPMPIRIFLVLFILALIYPSTLQAATESRTALVIGNSAYTSGPLKNPVNDAADMAAMLKKLGFSVTLKQNAKQQEMDEAIEAFGNTLKRGGVGLFYYAGHGVQVNGTNYLLPIGARINKEADVKYQAVDANKILDEMASANNSLNIVMLDACRDNPFTRSFRNAARGLAIVSSAPSGTFISYSTSPGNVAADGDGRNSPYTESLLKHMATPDLPIEQVFKKVRQELNKETNSRQIPWELSSLSGDFIFNSVKSQQQIQPADADKADQKNNFAEERRRLAEEKERLRREKELLDEKNALAEAKRRMEDERRKLEDEKQRLAYVPKVNPAKGSRYIDFLSAEITEVKFFEGGYDSPAKDQRAYRTSFSRTGTRYVWFELNLQHPMAGERKDFVVEHIWFNPHGNEIFRGNLNTYILESWDNSYHNHGYGWREASSSGWVAGTYRVDLYVNGNKIASENFNVY
jgi:uncharacterized caspase-like protein